MMSIGKMPTWLKRLNEWLTLFVTIVGVLTIIAGTDWLEAIRHWVYAYAPDAISTALRSIGWAIHSIIEPYRQAMTWVFGFLPFEIPDWLEAGLPPALIVATNFLVSRLLQHYAEKRSLRVTFETEESEKYLSQLGVQYETMINDDSVTIHDHALKDELTQMHRSERSRLLSSTIPLSRQRDRYESASLFWSRRAVLLAAVFIDVFAIEALYLALVR